MAKWQNLKESVEDVIKSNGNQEITGQVLQNVLKSIINNIGSNFSCRGYATPSTNPNTPDGNVYYFASQAGTYSNFGGKVLDGSQLHLLFWDGSWTDVNTNIGINVDKDAIIAEINQVADTRKTQLENIGGLASQIETSDGGNVQDKLDETDTTIDGLINNVTYELEKEYTNEDLLIGQGFYNFTYSYGKVYSGLIASGSGTTIYARLSDKITLYKGDKIVVKGGSSSTTRLFGIANTSNEIFDIDPGTNSYADTPYEFIAEQDCYVWINDCDNSSARTHSKFGLKLYRATALNTYAEDIDALEADVYKLKGKMSVVEDASLNKVVYNSTNYLTDGRRWHTMYVDEPLEEYTGQTTSSDNAYYDRLPMITLEKGEKISIRNYGNNIARAYCICNAKNQALVVASETSNNLTTPYVYTATQRVYVYINHRKAEDANNVFEVIVWKKAYKDKIADLEKLAPCISMPKVDIMSKPTLRVLDIGNSFTAAALEYITKFITASGINVSDMCLYKCARAGGNYASFYNSWHNQDNYNGTTGCHYSLVKVCGGLSATANGTTTQEQMQSIFKDNKWDIILIHQQSVYSADYELWNEDGAFGHLDDMLRILRTYQPQAMIGHLLVHSGYGQCDNGDTKARWQKIVNGYKFLQKNYGIDFVIPYGTAIENLRASSLKTDAITHGFGSDTYHPAHGLARYVANATYFHSLFGKRYGVSVWGNTARITASEVATNASGVDTAFQAEQIAVTDENAPTAQMCAILACSDMFSVYNPDNYISKI